MEWDEPVPTGNFSLHSEMYRFFNLAADYYFIIAQPPTGYGFSANGTMDSTIDPESGRTICFELNEGEKTMESGIAISNPFNLIWDSMISKRSVLDISPFPSSYTRERAPRRSNTSPPLVSSARDNVPEQAPGSVRLGDNFRRR